jgi:hypothetical protein
MKKVTLTFVVSDDVVYDIDNDLMWGDLGHAAETLNEKCEESDYNIEDVTV